MLTVLIDFDLDLLLTFIYWRQYMSMVSTLLQFIGAEREGNMDLHLSAFEAIGHVSLLIATPTTLVGDLCTWPI